MRLLEMNEDGDLSLKDHPEETEPEYAILSHRWSKDYKEVAFNDVIDNTYRDTRGYKKIYGCGEQAKWDGHQFFWIDTCCIDKSNSAELSESINSMWRYYCNSQVCYVYLDDVCADIGEAERNTAFAKSKWFTRGWTLQELLAPPKLEFYDAGWNIIGTKEDLAEMICTITKIDKRFLGSNVNLLRQASIAERMSWASGRQTTRHEDIAYCLLGIFDINMPLLYGEGTKAFQRLQEEIVKHSDDQSILAWTYSSAEIDSGKLFAPSPAAFAVCNDVVRNYQPGPVKPYSITNKGLKISLPLIRGDVYGNFLAVLNCGRQLDTFGSLALPVKQSGDSHQYQRRNGELQSVPLTDCIRARVQPMYISMEPLTDYSTNRLKDNTSILRVLPEGFEVSQIFPSGPCSHKTHTLEGNRHPDSPQDPNNRTLVELSSGGARRYLFMTFFHKNRIFHDCVWDARVLPVLIDNSSDIEEVFNAWKCKDLSTLQRVQDSPYGRVALVAVPQLIQGRRTTMIDVFYYAPDAWFIPREITEQILVVLRSIGYRLSRVIYWSFYLLFKGSSLSEGFMVISLILGEDFVSLLSKRDQSQNQSIATRRHLIVGSLYFIFGRLVHLWAIHYTYTATDKLILGWQDVREFDVKIGYSAVLVVFFFLPCVLFHQYFGYIPGAAWIVGGSLVGPCFGWAIDILRLCILR